MTDNEYKIDTADRLARIETKIDTFLCVSDKKASKSSVSLNRRLIFLLLTMSFALTAKVATSAVHKRKFVEVKPLASMYNFKVTTDKPINNFQVLSCHRHFYKNKKTKWFKYTENRTVEFSYIPVGIEQEFCPLHFGIFGEKGLSQLGYVDFESDNYKMQLTMLCNGSMVEVNGVGVCETKRNLTQVIYSSKPVSIYNTCTKQTTGGSTFKIKATGDICTHFIKDADGKLGRITLLAYDEV